MRILFIDNFDSFTYNVVELLRQFDELSYEVVTNDNLHAIELSDYDKVLISPGPDLPAAAGGLLPFLKQYATQIPILGICLGHQALAVHFGAELARYANPKHGEKTVLNILKQDGLFTNLPQGFEVGLYHSWYVKRESLPAELEITAVNEEGIIMAMQHKKWPLYSVQFHPESFMSCYGKEILHNFLISS